MTLRQKLSQIFKKNRRKDKQGIPSPPTVPADTDESIALRSPEAVNVFDRAEPPMSVNEQRSGDSLRHSEGMANKVTDTASGVLALKDSYVVSLVGAAVTSVAAESSVKSLLQDGIPGLINALEVLSQAHPFLAIGFLPFKLIYHQETQRRDNDKKRVALFLKIKDIMTELVEIKNASPKESQILSDRLTPLCEKLEIDIQECYNVLSTQERCSISIKFLKAESWNNVLAGYATRFVETRQQVADVIRLQTFATVNQTNQILQDMLDMLSQSSLVSHDERKMRRWFELHGGEEAVVNSDEACAELITFEASLSSGNPTSTVSWLSRERARNGEQVNEGDEKAISKAVSDFRKDYRKDVSDAVRDNLESYAKRFEMGLEIMRDDFKRDMDELGRKVVRQGDRMIKYLQDAEPSSRIQDAMIYHIWRNQGWKGSAKPGPLIVAIRDYFVERAENSRFVALPPVASQNVGPPSSPRPGNETYNPASSHDEDPVADINAALPDSWMTQHLSPKRLRYAQHILDPDYSGFATISEINYFTSERPKDWSTPRWISYWALGWQMFATKYCVEIEEMFSQMSLLRHQIGIRMPGNKTHVNEYIEGVWQHVTALTATSALERYEPPAPWLFEKFASHVEEREKMFKERLEKIQYRIDAVETVNLILDRDLIEYSIPALLALLLRRHLAKIHLCLKHEIDPRELRDDVATVTFVVHAAWQRFLDIKDCVEHGEVGDMKQTFNLLACGLFKNYLEWDSWLNPRYFMASSSDTTAASSANTIRDLDSSELENILFYSGTAEQSSAFRGVVSSTFSSSIAQTLTGEWFGFHRTEFQDPCAPMSRLLIQCSESGEISGSGNLFDDDTWTLRGSTHKSFVKGRFTVKFTCVDLDYCTKVEYSTTFALEQNMLVGSFSLKSIERENMVGSFFFRKRSCDEPAEFATTRIICFRPAQLKLNAKERWAFACGVVKDIGVRRRRASLLQKMSQIRRTLQLIHKQEIETLSLHEKSGLAQIYQGLSFEAYGEIYKLYQWYYRSVDLHLNRHGCDACKAGILRSRIVCLECISSSPVPNTVDFCSRSGCVDSPSLLDRADVSHHPRHTMIKTRDMFLLKDYSATKARAQYALHAATKASQHLSEFSTFAGSSPIPEHKQPLLSTPPAAPPAPPSVDVLFPMFMMRQPSGQSIMDSDQEPPINGSGSTHHMTPRRAGSSPTTPVSPGIEAPVGSNSDYPLTCLYCKRLISLPCWCCADCPINAQGRGEFICDSCEQEIDEMDPWDFLKRYRKENEGSSNSHTSLHLLVRVAARTKSNAGGDGRDANRAGTVTIQELGERVDNLEKKLEAIQRIVGRLEETEGKLSGGFGKLEELLKNLK